MSLGEILQKSLAGRPEGAPKRTGKELCGVWYRLMRPPFFITAAIPVCVALGFVMRAGYPLDSALWLRFAGLLLGCFCGLTIANLANELFDYVLGTDAREESIGGTGAIQSGLVSCRELFLAILFFVAVTIAIGLGLILSLPEGLHAPLILLTLFAVASAIFYVILAGTFELRALALALPVAGMVAGILYYQSLPEIETDLAAGKHTLANILGKDHALLVFRIWWPAVWILLGNLWLSDLAGWPVVFCLLSVPFWWKAQGLVASRGDGDWLPLDKYGYLVRLCYLISGAALVWGAAWK